MQKLIYIILFLLLAGNSFSQNSVWIDTVNSGPNQEVQFAVKIANAQLFTAFQLDITLPAVLGYKTNSLQLDPLRKVDHDITGSIVSGNVLRIIAYSITKNNFNGNNGTIAVFKCISKTIPGDYYLTPSNIILSDINNTNLSCSPYNGKYTLYAPAININLSDINFGSLPLGQINDQSISITNNGNLPLSVTSFSSNSSEMKCTDSSAIIIQPLQTIFSTIRFAPAIKGNKSGTLTIRSNDPYDSVKIITLTGIGYAVNEIHIGTIIGRSGQQGELDVSVNNMEPFTAFQFTLALPSVMKYVFGSAVLLRNTNHVINIDTISGNRLRVISYSPDNNNFTGNNDDILRLGFSLLGQAGSYTIPVSDAVISDMSNTNIISASYPGSLQIASPFLSLSSSQINFGTVPIPDTGHVNITLYNYGTDTLRINSINSNNPSFFITETFPIIILQGSQRIITVKLHSAAKGIYTGQLTVNSNDAPRSPSYIGLSGSIYVPNTLSVTTVNGLVNDTIAIPFTIENMDQFTAFQFDVTLPSEAVFIPNSVKLNLLRANGHSLSYSIQSNGAVRILAYSLNQSVFNGNSGEVVRFSVRLTSPQGIYPVTISNLVIGNILNQNVASGFNNGNVIINIGLRSNIIAFLQGLCSNNSMITSIRGLLPLNQPYNVGPWNYNGTENVAGIPSDVVDWVLLELWSNPSSLAARRAALLKSDGTAVDLDGVSPVVFSGISSGSYYIVVKHRNSIETWSPAAVNIAAYDFTSAQSQAFGGNMKLNGTKWCIYSGDVNQDGLADLSDLISIDNDNANYVSGYTNNDVNGDGLVDLSDLILVDNNNADYVCKIVPPGVPAANVIRNGQRKLNNN
jgi:hypothetical protein